MTISNAKSFQLIRPTSPNSIGYTTKEGIILLGRNPDRKYVYCMQMDITDQRPIRIDQAQEWIKNANLESKFGFSDWDIPTGYFDITNELGLIKKAAINFNDIFQLNKLFYGSKTPHSEKRNYEVAIREQHEISSFSFLAGSFFRAVRRDRQFVI